MNNSEEFFFEKSLVHWFKGHQCNHSLGKVPGNTAICGQKSPAYSADHPYEVSCPDCKKLMDKGVI